MPRRLTQRREPRVLAVLAARRGLRFASLDLDELRATGSLPPLAGRPLLVALRRLVARERPSVLAASTAALREALRLAGQGRLPLLSWPAQFLPPPSLRLLWPEAELFAPTKELQAVVGAAASLLLETAIPPRHYANRPP